MKNNISRKIIEILQSSTVPLTAREIMHLMNIPEDKYKYIASVIWSYKVKGLIEECDYKYCSIGTSSVKSWKLKESEKTEQSIPAHSVPLDHSGIVMEIPQMKNKKGITLVIRIDENGIEVISNEKIKIAS